MAAINRRAFVTATAASVAAPAFARAKECPAAGMDWMTMSLEARNSGLQQWGACRSRFRSDKTESWIAASKALREKRSKHLDLAYAPGERTKWDLYPATDPKAPCFVHIHGGYWQRNSREVFAFLAEGPLARGWSAALPGYTLAPEASLTQITNELRTAFDWLNARVPSTESRARHSHRLVGRRTSHGVHIGSPEGGGRGVDLGSFRSGCASRFPPCQRQGQVDRKGDRNPSPMRRPGVNKPLAIAYGTGELPAMIASSRDYHAYRSQAHLPGDLVPVVNTNHFTILDELRLPDSVLTRAVLQMAEYKTS